MPRAILDRIPSGTVVESIAQEMENPNASIAWDAAGLIEKIGPEPGLAAGLISALQHENSRVLSKAAVVLGRFGPAAVPARPALTATLDDRHSNVRAAAAEALKALDVER